MHDTIFIGLAVLLGLALAYVGVYLAAAWRTSIPSE